MQGELCQEFILSIGFPGAQNQSWLQEKHELSTLDPGCVPADGLDSNENLLHSSTSPYSR